MSMMRASVTIPDAVFHAADALARRNGWSRSELYARAIEAFVRADDDAVTQQLNKVYDAADSRLDPGLAGLNARILGDENW